MFEIILNSHITDLIDIDIGVYMLSLKKLLDTDIVIDSDLQKKWNSVALYLEKKYLYNTNDVGGVVAYKYSQDFIGLLNHLDIPKELHYLHIIVNGYKSSTDYDGINSSIKIIDTKEAMLYYEMFVQEKY